MESVATIVILAALGSVTSSVVLTGIDGYLDASTRSQLHTEASIGMDRMVRELRRIALDPSATGAAPDIDTISATSISWHGGDDAIALSGTDLLLTSGGGAAAVLLTDVSSLTVAAFDESNVSVSLPAAGAGCDAIRRVSLTVTLDRAGVTETLRSRIFLRSTMEGGGVTP